MECNMMNNMIECIGFLKFYDFPWCKKILRTVIIYENLIFYFTKLKNMFMELYDVGYMIII